MLEYLFGDTAVAATEDRHFASAAVSEPRHVRHHDGAKFEKLRTIESGSITRATVSRIGAKRALKPQQA